MVAKGDEQFAALILERRLESLPKGWLLREIHLQCADIVSLQLVMGGPVLHAQSTLIVPILIGRPHVDSFPSRFNLHWGQFNSEFFMNLITFEFGLNAIECQFRFRY